MKSSFARQSFAMEATEGTADAQQAGHYSSSIGRQKDNLREVSHDTFFGSEPESGSAGH
jgi:hypothetical protein